MPNAHSCNYDVSEMWPKTKRENADECIETLRDLSTSKRASAFHGAYRCDWEKIISSLDVHFKKTATDPDARKEEETRLLESFARDADPHLSPQDRRLIESVGLRSKTLRTTATLYVGRHYGLPTRSVDWTSDYLTALFFACRRHFNRDGVVWWMDNNDFTKALKRQWPGAYNGKKGDVEEDIEQDFFEGEGKDVFVRLDYLEKMQRARLQKAWITFSMKYGVRHDEELFRLGVTACGRLVVKASIKQELLNRLDRLGVNGSSLGLGGACVELIAADVAGSGKQDRA